MKDRFIRITRSEFSRERGEGCGGEESITLSGSKPEEDVEVSQMVVEQVYGCSDSVWLGFTDRQRSFLVIDTFDLRLKEGVVSIWFETKHQDISVDSIVKDSLDSFYYSFQTCSKSVLKPSSAFYKVN